MTTYVTEDGVLYSGNTPFEVVDAIRADNMFTEQQTVMEYMHAAAPRFLMSNNATIRVDSPENFVADLETAGILKRIDTQRGSLRAGRKVPR